MPPPPPTHWSDVPLRALTLRDAQRALPTALSFVAVVGLFTWMVHEVWVAAMLGAITALYLEPLYDRLQRIIPLKPLVAIFALLCWLGPLFAVLVYSYVELCDVSEQLLQHRDVIAKRLNAALNHALPWLEAVDIRQDVSTHVTTLAEAALKLPEVLQEAIAKASVSFALYAMTAFYVIQEKDRIASYVGSRVPEQYAELAQRVRQNVRGVLYGTIYGVVVSQSIKSVVIFLLCALFEVPAPALLAVVSFLIGFFPILGSWAIYAPASVYLFVFQQAPLKAIALLGVGLMFNTLLVSMVLRPRLAAQRSQTLNFYWMFVGLISGVYAFGVPGLVLGPILIGLLKAFAESMFESREGGREAPDHPLILPP